MEGILSTLYLELNDLLILINLLPKILFELALVESVDLLLLLLKTEELFLLLLLCFKFRLIFKLILFLSLDITLLLSFILL